MASVLKDDSVSDSGVVFVMIKFAIWKSGMVFGMSALLSQSVGKSEALVLQTIQGRQMPDSGYFNGVDRCDTQAHQAMNIKPRSTASDAYFLTSTTCMTGQQT